MTNSDDIFNDETPPSPDLEEEVVPNPPVETTYADQLGMIKNTDGTPKYDSVQKALDALAQSQTHIATLESESAVTAVELVDLRNKVSSTDTVDEVIARLNAIQDAPAQATPQPTVDEDAVKVLIKNALEANQNTAQREANVDLVQRTLILKYGDKASDVITAKAEELGITNETLREMSSSNPKVALALFEVSAPRTDAPTSTSVNLERDPQKPETVDRPSKSLLMGATSKEQADFLAKITKQVYEKHNVEI